MCWALKDSSICLWLNWAQVCKTLCRSLPLTVNSELINTRATLAGFVHAVLLRHAHLQFLDDTEEKKV